MSKKDLNKGLEIGIGIKEELLKMDIKALEALLKEAKMIRQGQEVTAEIVHTLIEELNEQDCRRLYGLKDSLDVKGLEVEEKQILLNVIATLAKGLGNNYNENQKKFFLNLKTYLEVLGFSEDVNYKLEYLENIDSHETCLVLTRAISRFLFLTYENCSFLEEYDELFEYLNLRNKEIDSIKQMLNDTYDLFGAQGIVSIYGNYEDEEIEETTGAVLDNIIRIKIDSRKMKDIEFGSTKINNGETREFTNANVYVNADILCEGVIKFENCIIHYNSNSKIELSGGAIVCNRCKFECDGIPKDSFINDDGMDKGENKLIFDECLFYECTNLVKMYFCEKVLISNSLFEDCYGTVFSVEWLSGTGYYSISKCKLKFENIKTTENKTKYSENYFCEEFFGVKYTRALFEMKKSLAEPLVNISEIIVENSNNVFTECVFRINKNVEYYNCKFVGLKAQGIIQNTDSVKVIDSEFVDCKKVISCSNQIIQDCYFEKCSEIINERGYGNISVKIVECVFNECYDNLIKLDASHENTISKCKFYNISSDKTYDILGSASILISGGKDSRGGVIEKCMFKGVKLNESFLIEARVHERAPYIYTNIKECAFEDCSTNRKNRELIKQYDNYYGAFNKQKTIKVASIASSCVGLNSVKRDSKVGYYSVTKEVNQKGEKIGPSIEDIQIEVI